MKGMCPLKTALKMGASQISYFEACLYFGPDYAILRRRASHIPGIGLPVCQQGQSERIFPIFVFTSCFSCLLPDFPSVSRFFFTLCPNFLGGNSECCQKLRGLGVLCPLCSLVATREHVMSLAHHILKL